jgi:tetratricopeptide (TPR) repeat protein
MQQFDGYQDGRLNYKEMGREGKEAEAAVRPADPEQALAWATIFLRFGSLHRAYVLLQELESENRVALITQAAVNHALKARQHRGAGQHARAIAELDLAIRSRADIAYFYFTAADSCLKNQDLRGAAALYNRLLEAFPACERGYLSLGEVLEQRGELPKAIRSYEKVLAFNPHSAAALQKRRRAEERLRAGDGDQVAGAPGAAGGDRSLAREFLQDLTTLAERKQLAPRLGGEETLSQLIEILCCKERSSASSWAIPAWANPHWSRSWCGAWPTARCRRVEGAARADDVDRHAAGRREVPRPVRGADDLAHRGDQEARLHPGDRPPAHAGVERHHPRRQPRRRQPAQAGAQPRRGADHRHLRPRGFLRGAWRRTRG